MDVVVMRVWGFVVRWHVAASSWHVHHRTDLPPPPPSFFFSSGLHSCALFRTDASRSQCIMILSLHGVVGIVLPARRNPARDPPPPPTAFIVRTLSRLVFAAPASAMIS